MNVCFGLLPHTMCNGNRTDATSTSKMTGTDMGYRIIMNEGHANKI